MTIDDNEWSMLYDMVQWFKEQDCYCEYWTGDGKCLVCKAKKWDEED